MDNNALLNVVKMDYTNATVLQALIVTHWNAKIYELVRFSVSALDTAKSISNLNFRFMDLLNPIELLMLKTADSTAPGALVLSEPLYGAYKAIIDVDLLPADLPGHTQEEYLEIMANHREFDALRAIFRNPVKMTYGQFQNNAEKNGFGQATNRLGVPVDPTDSDFSDLLKTLPTNGKGLKN